ncbi:MAG: methyltransferase domain-containing protein [Rhizomicrobium sp.]
MDWDPNAYLAFAGERNRAAGELLARIGLRSPGRIADLGCGTGASASLLAARWPEAEIDGIDSSPDMLAKARRSGAKARWIMADIGAWQPDRPYDLVYSNAALHWVGDHERLLPKLLSFLSPGGVLAFQVPRNFTEPSHTIAQELAKAPRWAEKLAGARDWWTILEPEAYCAILEPLAPRIDIWETRYLHRLKGPDAVFQWVLGSGLRPYRDALREKEREAFLAQYRTLADQAYPQRRDGITLFPFKRLFCIAARP